MRRRQEADSEELGVRRGSVYLVKVGISRYEEKQMLLTQNKSKDCQRALRALLAFKPMPLILGGKHLESRYNSVGIWTVPQHSRGRVSNGDGEADVEG